MLKTGDSSLIAKYKGVPVTVNDYSPFGMLLPGRDTFDPQYRFGFNGKENDLDFRGVGQITDYGARIYNARLGRFLSVDPLQKKFAFYTPYQFAGNKPISCVDLDGLEDAYYTVNVIKNGLGKVEISNITENESMRAGWLFSENATGKRGHGDLYTINIVSQDLDGKPYKFFSFQLFQPKETALDKLANFFSSGDESKSSKIGYQIFGSETGGKGYEDRLKNPKAAFGTQVLDLEKMISALELWRDIPSEEYGTSLTDFIKNNKNMKKSFEKLDAFGKAISAIISANNGEFPTGKKDLPPGFEKKPEPVKDSILKPATGLMRDPNGLIYGFDNSSGPTTIYSNDSKTPDTIRTTIYEKPKKR